MPLVIGITGHRDLRPEDLPGLESALRGVIGGLQSQYPHTRLLMLSSLAEGADRLGARIALEAGAMLVVPLPMDVAEYELDFKSEASRREFRDLLERAHHFIELPPMAPAHNDERNAPAPRDERYERAAAFVAASSQIMIALWDGVVNGRVGGTSENVRFKLNGVDPRYRPGASLLDSPETGPVIHIRTPRISNPNVAEPLRIETLYPSSPGGSNVGERGYEQRVFGRIETYNADAVSHEPAIAGAVTRSSGYLSPRPDSALNAGAAAIRRIYAVTDALALHFQIANRRMLLTLFVWIFVAAVLFEAYKGLAEGFHFLVGLYAAAVAAAFLWYYFASREDHRSKFLDYRALAEGLRVQFFWWLGDIREDVASHYLRKQRDELDWIRVASANANILANVAHARAAAPHEHDPKTALETVLSDWVVRQRDYYVRATWRDQKLADRLDSLAQWFLWAAIALTVVRGLLLVVHTGVFQTAADWLAAAPETPRVLDVFITVLFVVAALLHNYSEKRALSQQAKQYERMSVMFEACATRLPGLIEHRHYGQARELIRELGREALNENADWVVLHRERPLELSVKG